MRYVSILSLIFLSALQGCSSWRYAAFASRMEVPEDEVAEVARAAVAHYHKAIVDMHRTPSGEISISFGDSRHATSGFWVVFKKDGKRWVEEKCPDGEYRAWACP